MPSSAKSIESPLKSKRVGLANQSAKVIGSESNVMFKKKSTSIREYEFPASKLSPGNSKSRKSIQEEEVQR